MALSADRMTDERDGVQLNLPVAASTRIYAGGMTALNSSGYAVPAAATATLTVVGRAEEQVDNSTGAAGDLDIAVKHGVFRYQNSTSTDLITRAEIGDTCYVVDDETVAKTDNSAARPAAGTVVDVDALGVWVRI